MSQKFNFFFDIDGTLIHDGLTPSAAVVEALRYAQSRGCRIFINTGRTKTTLPSAITELDCIDGFLCGCGTYIECGGKPILQQYIPQENTIKIAEKYYDFGMEACMFFEGVDNVFYCGKTCRPFSDIRYIQIPSAKEAKELLSGERINKLSLHLPAEYEVKFLDLLAGDFQTMKCPTYYEIVPFGFDKGRAIELTEQILGLDHALSVAVGDSENDVKMLDYTPISVAMGNADEDIKKRCTLVTDSVQNDGVAKMIYELVK